MLHLFAVDDDKKIKKNKKSFQDMKHLFHWEMK